MTTAFQRAFDSGELFDLDFQFSQGEEWGFAMDRVRALGAHRKPLQWANRDLERVHGLLAEHLFVVRENKQEIRALAATAIQTITRCHMARKRVREIEAEWEEAGMWGAGQYTLNDGPSWDDYNDEEEVEFEEQLKLLAEHQENEEMDSEEVPFSWLEPNDLAEHQENEEMDSEEEEEMEFCRRYRANQMAAQLIWSQERQEGWVWSSVMAKNHMVRCFEQELDENLTINHVLEIGCNV
jgi:hypothetical protein